MHHWEGYCRLAALHRAQTSTPTPTDAWDLGKQKRQNCPKRENEVFVYSLFFFFKSPAFLHKLFAVGVLTTYRYHPAPAPLRPPPLLKALLARCEVGLDTQSKSELGDLSKKASV